MELTAFNVRLAESVLDKARHYGARLWQPTEAELELVRLPRLSIVPVTEAQWRRVEELSRE